MSSVETVQIGSRPGRMYSDQFPAGPAWARTRAELNAHAVHLEPGIFPGTTPESWSPSPSSVATPVTPMLNLKQMRAGGVHSAVVVIKVAVVTEADGFVPNCRCTLFVGGPQGSQ